MDPHKYEPKTNADKKKENVKPASENGNVVKKAAYVPPILLRMKGLSLDDPKGLKENDKTTDDGKEEKDQADPDTQKRQARDPEDDILAREYDLVAQYIRDRCPVFCELADLRLKGWNNPEGEEYFKKQRFHTDNADLDTSYKFLRMMRNVADKMQSATNIFTLPTATSSRAPTILGFGFAPGGFVEKALALNPTATATGFSIAHAVGGIPVLISGPNLQTHYADITLMAGDLGITPDQIPASHPDATQFLPRLIRPRAQFDLVTCEGGVLRPHVSRLGVHREVREAHRLRAAQLALGLARVKSGGRMIVLMHKAEAWSSLSLLYTFSRFSRVRLFKPEGEHQYKSSFYMLATEIRSQSEEARQAVRMWTREWRVACFGSDEEYKAELGRNKLDVDKVLWDFGDVWLELSREVWDLQREGLKVKSFTQGY